MLLNSKLSFSLGLSTLQAMWTMISSRMELTGHSFITESMPSAALLLIVSHYLKTNAPQNGNLDVESSGYFDISLDKNFSPTDGRKKVESDEANRSRASLFLTFADRFWSRINPKDIHIHTPSGHYRWSAHGPRGPLKIFNKTFTMHFFHTQAILLVH